MTKTEYYGIPEDISSISGELYAAINKAVGDPKWRDDEYKEYLASLKEERIDKAETPEEKRDNRESMCVEIQAALDYLPAREENRDSCSKDVAEAAHTAIQELDLNNGQYQEIVQGNPDISKRARSFVETIKHNAKKLTIAALMASMLIGAPGKFSLTKEAEALDLGRILVTGTLSAIASSTSVSYSDGEFDFDFDGEYFGDKLGRNVRNGIQDTFDDTISGMKRGYEDGREYTARVKKAGRAMANALEALSPDGREVALRTFVMAHEMGGTNQVESAVLAQINNATSGTGLSKSQLQDVNLFVKEVSNNYKYSDSSGYSIEDSYKAALKFLGKRDGYDREQDMLKTMVTTASLTSQAIKNENVKTANVLLGMMDRMYDSSKEYYDSSSMRKLVKETRQAVREAAEKYSTKETVAKYNLNAIDVEPISLITVAGGALGAVVKSIGAAELSESEERRMTLEEKAQMIRQQMAEREDYELSDRG